MSDEVSDKVTDASPPVYKRRSLALRLAVLVGLLASGLLLVRFTPMGELMSRERMILLFESLGESPWTPLILIGMYCGISPLGLPVSPILVGGGVVFGPVLGSVYNVLGQMAGALVGYFIAKGIGREAIVGLAGPRLRKAEMLFEKRGFWTLVQVRFVPIPFSIVNYAAALAGVRLPRFLITSLIGLIPATVMHTYFAPAWFLKMLNGEDAARIGMMYMATWVGLNIVAGWPQLQGRLKRRKRYRELVARRRELGR